jgi:hypothetical protein
MPDREDGMARLEGYRVAADGKLRGNNLNRTAKTLAGARRLVFAAVTLFFASFLTSICGSASYAQSGPFAGLAGSWSGGGTVTLDDGSTERLRCRATYAVGAGGTGLNLNLTCASDAYKFNFACNVLAEGGALSGTWSETTRNVSGSLEGRGGNGNFQVVASAPGFTANISLTTRGTKQSVAIKSDSVFRAVALSLSKS